MDERTSKERTRKLAIALVQLAESLPRNQTATILGTQLLRSGTSVGANYRAACRGKSAAKVIAKLSIVEEEADESICWMELLVDAHVVERDRASPITKEANELLAVTVASIKTLRSRHQRAA